MKLAIYICTYLIVVHADDEQHQPNLDGGVIHDLNVHPTDDEHQAVREVIPDLNVHPTNDEHQTVGEAIPDLNMRPTYDEHQAHGEAIPDLNVQPTHIEQQADGDVAFDVLDEQDDFYLNLLVPGQHEEMQQSMISNLH